MKIKESEHLIFRRLRDSDLELLKTFFDTESTKFLTLEQIRHFLDTLAQSTNQFGVIGVLQNQIICFASVLIEKKINGKRCLHIEDVWVGETHRRRGVGRRLIMELTREAREEDCYKATLACSEDNIEFYRKCEFKLGGFEMNFYNESFHN